MRAFQKNNPQMPPWSSAQVLRYSLPMAPTAPKTAELPTGCRAPRQAPGSSRTQQGRFRVSLALVLPFLAALSVLWAGCSPREQQAPSSPVPTSVAHATAPAAAASRGRWAAPAARALLPSGGSTIALAQLPPRGQQVYAAILGGGPYAFDKDGVIFANRERILPAHPRGYYREYTVAEPDARNRGPRRIVCGGPRQQPDACYYSADHYASFQKIEP